MTFINRLKHGWREVFPWIRVFVVIGLIALVLDRGEGPPRYEVDGRARLVDGDSLYVEGLEIRLKNIDAPEGRQKCQRNGRNWLCGQEATRRLRTFIKRRKLTCKGNEYDRHNRLLAFCSVGGVEINQWMVREGWAVSFGDYRREERAAKRARKGIWSSQFQRPRSWR
ncbi:MAG: thermonuclease family protein, partial [Hyphomicrobiaceae bacterium]|nr:thermonuclease family protein [Hyphomicrobiaceae bacterium]